MRLVHFKRIKVKTINDTVLNTEKCACHPHVTYATRLHAYGFKCPNAESVWDAHDRGLAAALRELELARRLPSTGRAARNVCGEGEDYKSSCARASDEPRARAICALYAASLRA